MSIAIQQYSRQTQSMLALLKTFGASRRQVMQLLGGLLSLLSLAGIAIGCLLGWLIHRWMVWQLAAHYPLSWQQRRASPLYLAFVLGGVLVSLLVCIPLWRFWTFLRCAYYVRSRKAVYSWLALPMLIIGLLLINLLLVARFQTGIRSGRRADCLDRSVWRNGLFIITVITERRTGSSFYLAVQHWQRQPLEILHQLSGIALSLLLLGVVISVRSEIVGGFQTFFTC